jgi:hypothetical protein
VDVFVAVTQSLILQGMSRSGKLRATMYNAEAVRSLVRGILEEALEKSIDHAPSDEMEGWSLQGFGMLRRHLPGDFRLNVWDSRYRVKDVSLIHDHPWHFESFVVNGVLRNTRFIESKDGALFNWSQLKPGPGGGLLVEELRGADPRVISGWSGALCLSPQRTETYERGATYEQRRDEVHLSDPEDGTVTFNRRFDRTAEDVARVFWPVGKRWVSAEPRVAKASELNDIISMALSKWAP